ncbi:MAG TPA: hypothetical protein VNS19_23655 [Acidimicrobiales bacterium]|nr:hypothetical protein [Acidimicrobiales bacterium]
MRGCKVRKLALLIGIGALVALLVKKLRGEPAPQFSNHPTVKGGPLPDLVPAPTDPTVPSPADADTALVPAPTDPTVPAPEAAAAPAPAPAAAQPELDLPPLVAAPDDPTVAADAGTALVAELTDPTAPSAPAAEPGAPAGPTEQAWVEPVDGACPDGYPVKAKIKSGIYHQPGGLAYDRTNPDRCYPDARTAEADGLRAAKR